jgi:geranylgeranyl reductase family protein
MTATNDLDADVIVVGGGPAGSVAAALLAERGHHVLLLDKARFPRHKPCSEYVNPAGARILSELGLERDLQSLGAHQVESMAIHAPGGRRFLVDFAATTPGNWALGISRYRLDAMLLERARQSGVQVREGAHVRDLVVTAGHVSGVAVTIDGRREGLSARLVIGADGRHSVVARALDLDRPLRWLRRTGLVAHYRGVMGLERGGEMHVARHGYAGLAPLEEGLTNVAFVADSAAVAARSGTLDEFFAAGLARMPLVATRLAGAERQGGIRGMGPMAHRAQRVYGDGFLLVGDAAGFLDPFTGDGIYEAMRGALLAAPVADAALRSDDLSASRLAPYSADRERSFRAKRRLRWLVQGFVSRPALLDYAAGRLLERPQVAATLTGVLGDLLPAGEALSPRFLAQLLRP